MWSGGDHARRKRLTGGVWIVRGQSVRISTRELDVGLTVGAGEQLSGREPERIGGRDVERGREQRVERSTELGNVDLRDLDQLAGRFVGRERSPDLQRHDQRDSGHMHVQRVVVAGVDVVDFGRDRRPRLDL